MNNTVGRQSFNERGCNKICHRSGFVTHVKQALNNAEGRWKLPLCGTSACPKQNLFNGRIIPTIWGQMKMVPGSSLSGTNWPGPTFNWQEFWNLTGVSDNLSTLWERESDR